MIVLCRHVAELKKSGSLPVIDETFGNRSFLSEPPDARALIITESKQNSFHIDTPRKMRKFKTNVDTKSFIDLVRRANW